MIPEGLTREHILLAIDDFHRGVPHDFADSTRYDLVVEGERFPPKAIVGLAAAHILGHPLKPADFSGGIGSSSFRILNRLGFRVVPKPDFELSRFEVGAKYTRADIYERLAVPQSDRRGDWDTGYHRYHDEWFVFCGIGTAGRTGHDYGNHFEGQELVWFGKPRSRVGQPAIDSLLSGDLPVHIFFRTSDRDPFEYAGLAHVVSVDIDSVPVRVRWGFGSDDTESNQESDEEGDAKDGQGYQHDPAVRKAVEERAMLLAQEHYEQLGYDVERTAEMHPFDLRCRKESLEVRVEVKGTTSRGSTINLTHGEVENARGVKWRTDLFLVTKISVAHKPLVASGGLVRVIEAWRPADEALKPVVFSYQVPK